MSLILSLTLKLDLCDDQQPTLQQELVHQSISSAFSESLVVYRITFVAFVGDNL
jgi:hypothetical protein